MKELAKRLEESERFVELIGMVNKVLDHFKKDIGTDYRRELAVQLYLYGYAGIMYSEYEWQITRLFNKCMNDKTKNCIWMMYDGRAVVGMIRTWSEEEHDGEKEYIPIDLTIYVDYRGEFRIWSHQV